MIHWFPASWPAPAGIVAGTTLRAAGDFGRNGGQAMAQGARDRLAAGLQVPAIHWLQQVHGIDVLELPVITDLSQADAVIASGIAQACAVLTADCLPVLLCAMDGSVVGAAHAGWRGLLAGVLENTVMALRQRSQAPLLAWLGPAIGPVAFEVGPEVRHAFVARDRRATTAFVAGRQDRWLADLDALARQRLADAGIAAEHVYGGGQCTQSDPVRWFSYRRDGAASGRMASVVMRRA